MNAPRSLATVYVTGDPEAFLVAETPREVLALIEDAERTTSPHFVRLTLTGGTWVNKPVHVRASHIQAIGPPAELDEDDEDE